MVSVGVAGAGCCSGVRVMVSGKVGEFERGVLVGGVLGHLGPGRDVVWGGLLDGVGYRGWDLFG